MSVVDTPPRTTDSTALIDTVMYHGSESGNNTTVQGTSGVSDVLPDNTIEDTTNVSSNIEGSDSPSSRPLVNHQDSPSIGIIGSPATQTSSSHSAYGTPMLYNHSPTINFPQQPPHLGTNSSQSAPSTADLDPDLDLDQSSQRKEPHDDKSRLIAHFASILSESLTISIEGESNPFREHLLPLAYHHEGVMEALLGLSACHMYMSGKDETQHCMTLSLKHRVAALRILSLLLLKEEEMTHLVTIESILAIVLLLVTHDICETGVSSHGAHLTGVEFLCSRLASSDGSSKRSKTSMFLVSALTWLDMLRGFSGAEKLMYSADVRDCVRDHGSLSLHTLVGCPPAIFHRIGQVLQTAKEHLAGKVGLEEFKHVLGDTERFLRGWDPDQVTYPTGRQEWKQLAEAFRHACLLRVLRFPDAFTIPCTDPRIQESVSAILGVCAEMPRDSVFYKRLLFPLFLAGADTASSHQIHYTSWCVSEIKQSTGFQHPAMTELLTEVWAERTSNSRGWINVPWMEFTCSSLLATQHAYLFF